MLRAAVEGRRNNDEPATPNTHRFLPLRFSVSRFTSHVSRGFTLIELLVVVVIVAVLAVALVLSVGGSAERSLANESERFQSLLGHACSEAELMGREIGVVVSANGYAFQRLDGDAWHDFDRGNELRARQWPGGLRLQFTREGRPLELATPERMTPQLVCFSSGELTPFVLTLALGDAPLRYRIVGADDGTLKTSRVEGPP